MMRLFPPVYIKSVENNTLCLVLKSSEVRFINKARCRFVFAIVSSILNITRALFLCDDPANRLQLN